MTGTAELVAQEIELAFGGDDLVIDTMLMDELDAGVFARSGVFLICTSTYGHGDVPDNAKAFYADLVARKPDLANVRYGVFALGDRTHVGTFCDGGRHFDEVLAAAGAQRIGDVAQHDASGGTLAEDAALEWFPRWLDEVRQSATSEPR
jgi:MioC protein